MQVLLLHRRALKVDPEAQIIPNPRKGYRKGHPLGSTYVPSKVLVIHGKKFSLAAANQYLEGKKCQMIEEMNASYVELEVVKESLEQFVSTCADEEVSEYKIHSIRFEVRRLKDAIDRCLSTLNNKCEIKK